MMTKTIKGTTLYDLERAYEKILAWFYAYPQDEFSLNDLAKALDIAKASANTIVSKLKEDGFLENKVLGRLWRIKANPKHPYFTTKKIPFNLHLIYESGILEWISENIPNARAIVLFGSYRKGDDMPESDVDIAVEVLSNEPMKTITLTAKSLGYRKDIPMQIHIFSRNHIDLNLFASIANGIILKGFLEVRP
mgnify:CR=1 FL=1